MLHSVRGLSSPWIGIFTSKRLGHDFMFDATSGPTLSITHNLGMESLFDSLFFLRSLLHLKSVPYQRRGRQVRMDHLSPQQRSLGTAHSLRVITPLLIEGIAAFVQSINLITLAIFKHATSSDSIPLSDTSIRRSCSSECNLELRSKIGSLTLEMSLLWIAQARGWHGGSNLRSSWSPYKRL